MTLEGTNTYLVGSAPCYVIDPGPAIDSHLEAILSAAQERGGIAGILLTHSHADHSEAVPFLDAPLLWGEVSEGSEMAPAPPTDTGKNAAAEPIGPFTLLPSPGHAADHICFTKGDVAFCGDLLLGHGSSIVPPRAMGGSLADYMESLAKLCELRPALLCPGHGPWITEPEAKIDEYIAHRTDRERKLLAALEAGVTNRDALLDAAWEDVPEPMRPAAAVALQAHLERLEAEGRLP
jgi:glyoxylase-like metal-dependent hydrolase (beta-lactamase superfamily II)